VELLQNANDQAGELNELGRVLIDLFPGGMVVANTGAPFSTTGLESLQVANLSPKTRGPNRKRRRRFIGSKGLGFRSILNWTSSPLILSRALRIAYSRGIAKHKLSDLMSASQELANLVKEAELDAGTCELPLLCFPGYSQSGDVSQLIPEPAGQAILARCETWVREAYVTAIGMPFDDPEAHESALAQLKELRPEILLFTQSLKEIRFRCGDSSDQVWTCDEHGSLTRILANGHAIGEWRVFRMSGELPEEVRDSDHTSLEYEIVVAVPAKDTKPSTLFSYFPTDITLPLPLVCHATLELEQNRKHARMGSGNQFVFEKLACFVAEIAEKMAADNNDNDPWAGCSLLRARGNYPIDLDRVKFGERLIEASQSRAVVPTLGGSPQRPHLARLIPGASAEWLPIEPFSDVVPVRSCEDAEFLEALRVPQLESTELKRRLAKLPALTIDERALLIHGILRNALPEEVHSPSLLIDSNGKPVPEDARIFLLPTSGTKPDLPEWVDVRFLSETLRAGLSKRLGTRNSAELQWKLDSFGVSEYSLDNLIRALLAATKRRMKNEPEQIETYAQDLLYALWKLFPAELPPTKRPEFPETSQVLLRNQRGELEPANSLYIGKGFTPFGEITQGLFEGWDHGKLVAPPEQLGLDGDTARIREFLMWLGVAVWPRQVIKDVETGFLTHVLRRITYPARFDDRIFNSPELVERPSITVKGVDGLDEILTHADPLSIVAWLAFDERAHGWQRLSPEHGTLRSKPYCAQNARQFRGELPSYVRWAIETRRWMALSDGSFVAPKDCVLGERTVEALFPQPARPDQSGMARYGLKFADVKEAWRRSGVLTSLADLEREEIYARLIELPDRSPDGQLARSLYRWLLDAGEIADGESGVHHAEFLARGKMWGHHDGKSGYFPASELQHTDGEGLPEELLKRLKIVDLPRRAGADKVKRLFGVAEIDHEAIEQRVKNRQIAIGSRELDTQFQAAKPYFYMLRGLQTTHHRHLQKLKDVRLEVCSELFAEIRYESDSFEYEVPVWGWLLPNEGDVLYVRSDPASQTILPSALLADVIGQALASMLRRAEGGEFARIFMCSETDRPALLRKIRGESDDEDLQAIRVEFASVEDDFLHHAQFAITAPLRPQTRSEPLTNGAKAVTSPDNGSGTEAVQPAKSAELHIREEEHTPTAPASLRKLRVQTTASSRRSLATLCRITDSGFCERKVLEFEQADDPPRFALLVSHVTGYEGPRCDILSFATAADREAFGSGTKRDLRLVQRFIEVKGRSERSAIIELKGNELSAAVEHGEKYYLYRLFDAGDGAFILSVLQNPLEHKNALQQVVHVSLDRAEATRKFSLEGGIQLGHQG
jgi:Domain of unknown function (DUF3883)